MNAPEAIKGYGGLGGMLLAVVLSDQKFMHEVLQELTSPWHDSWRVPTFLIFGSVMFYVGRRSANMRKKG